MKHAGHAKAKATSTSEETVSLGCLRYPRMSTKEDNKSVSLCRAAESDLPYGTFC